MKYIILFFTIINISFSYGQVIQSGNIINSSVLNEKFNNYKKESLGYGYMPIGSIIPFHKNTGIGLTIPEGWEECNGSNVSVKINGPLDPDGDGLYTVPDLNTQVYSPGKGRYLRGGTSSGNYNASSAWRDNGAAYTPYGNSPGIYGMTFGRYYNTETHSSLLSYISGARINPENYRFQVTAMTVIYIMRVK